MLVAPSYCHSACTSDVSAYNSYLVAYRAYLVAGCSDGQFRLGFGSDSSARALIADGTQGFDGVGCGCVGGVGVSGEGVRGEDSVFAQGGYADIPNAGSGKASAGGDSGSVECADTSKLADCGGSGNGTLEVDGIATGEWESSRGVDVDGSVRIESFVMKESSVSDLPGGGAKIGVGKNWQRNQQWKAEKKRKKLARGLRRASAALKSEDWNADKSRNRSALRESLERKWQVENELARVKAERQLQVLQATDVSEEAKKYRTQVCRATERNMVSIERIHNRLREQGNSTDEEDSRVRTVVSGSSSISPGSSVSEAEVRALQKEHADLVEKHKRVLETLEKVGIDFDVLENRDKEDWTVDMHGRLTEKNEAILDKLYPEGFVAPCDPYEVGHNKWKMRIMGF